MVDTEGGLAHRFLKFFPKLKRCLIFWVCWGKYFYCSWVCYDKIDSVDYVNIRYQLTKYTISIYNFKRS